MDVFSVAGLPLASAFLLGLMGSAHCLGMCGGLMAALGFAVPAQRGGPSRVILIFCYNLGRIASYTLIGALAGWLGWYLQDIASLKPLRWAAGLLLIAMGLYLAGWWQGLTYLERAGSVLWRHIQPFGQKLMPVRSAQAALFLGVIWGWLPCGLVYSALAYSLAQAAPTQAAAVMLAFGLGTLPAVFLAGIMAERLQRLLRLKGLRSLMALSVILFGLWTIYGTLGHGSGHSGHSAHAQDHGHEPASSTATEHSSEAPMSEHHDHHHR